MPRKLFEVTVSKTFYYLGEKPPGELEAERCASDEGLPFEVAAHAVRSDTLGAGLDSLVHGPDEDLTLAEAIAEVTSPSPT